jgi:hypothetical protein
VTLCASGLEVLWRRCILQTWPILWTLLVVSDRSPTRFRRRLSNFSDQQDTLRHSKSAIMLLHLLRTW